MTLKTFVTLSCLALPSYHLRAQSLQNVKATFQDGRATIVYDLTGGKASQKYSLELFSSHNDFSTPLTRLTGDIGKNVSPGTEKKIIWNAADELGEYHGEISLRVRASLIVMPFVFITPAEGGTVRRGKKTNLSWDGGSPSQNVKLELLKGTERISAVTETKNNGQYIWSVPKDLSKGNYNLKLTSQNESIVSSTFKVKSKVPMMLKVLPLVALGGIVAILGGSNKSEKGGGSQDLPSAPGPH